MSHSGISFYARRAEFGPACFGQPAQGEDDLICVTPMKAAG
jgi:hypothetical protein